MPETEQHHTVTAEWDKNGMFPALTFRCAAPAESLCHAVYDCQCEGWTDAGIENGRPWHGTTEYDDEATDGDRDVRHWGRLDPDECGQRDWFENTDEALHGSVTFPVRAEWEGDYYTFHPETSPALSQPTNPTETRSLTMSEQTVYKYPFSVEDEQAAVTLPPNGVVLHLDRDPAFPAGSGRLAVWALVDPTETPAQVIPLEAAGTGHPAPSTASPQTFLATVLDGPFVWHIFQVSR